MKRVIRSSYTPGTKFPNDWEQMSSTVNWKGKGRYRFSGTVSRSRGIQTGTISKIAPYDDADYVWAKIEANGLVKFIKNGKIIDKMQLSNYLDFEEDFESVEEFWDNDMDGIIEVLVDYNSKIEPRMIHN